MFTKWPSAESAVSNSKEPRSGLGRVFNSKLGRIVRNCMVSACYAIQEATSRVENFCPVSRSLPMILSKLGYLDKPMH